MPTHSPYPDLINPGVDIATFLFERKDREYPDDHVLFVDVTENKKQTFRQFRNVSTEFGTGLRTHWKWQKGDVLAIFSPNSTDIAAVTLGTLMAGGVLCPANNLYTVAELASILKSSGAKALVTHLTCLEAAREAALIVGLPLNRIVLVGQHDENGKTKHFTSLQDIATLPKVQINPREDLSFLVYSSGTTGLPKGVMLSHENLVANIQQNNVPGIDPFTWKHDSIITFLPMFHIYGVATEIFVPLYCGVTIYIMQRFILEEFCSNVQSKKITGAYIVPPVALLLAKHPIIDIYDLSSLKVIHSAASPLAGNLIEKVYERLGAPIRQSYGMSEASPAIATQKAHEWRTTIGSVGKMVPSMSVKIMDGDKEVSNGEEGEIWMKGPNIFKGYYQNPKATAECMTGEWFHSGDIGYVDIDGNLFLTDRFKELIKYNGYQVAPAQLEGLLQSHPAVDDVAVIGVYDKDRATELPRAYVVAAKGHTPSPELEKAIIEWLHPKVAPHKRLRGGIRFTDEIPKSAAGKLLRRVLTEQAKKEESENAVKAKL